MLAWSFWWGCLCLGGPTQEPDQASIQRLVEQLGADFLEERDAARKALEKLGSKGELRLIAGLASNDHRIRRNCLELLTEIKSEKSMERGGEIFRADEDPSVRDAAFKLLQSLGKGAEDHLIAALESPTAAHRLGAVQSLSGFKSAKCAEKMSALHERENDPEVKAAAFQCLQSLGYLPFLLKCLKSPEPALRRDAFTGLATAQTDEVLSAVGALFASESDASVIDKAFAYLREAKEKAEPHFLAGLKNAAEEARIKSIEGLGSLKSDLALVRAIPPVAEALENDAQDRVREAARDFLMARGLKAEEPLIRALASANVKVRLAALEALGGIKSEKPMAQVAKIFREDRDRAVHRKAFDYLEKLGIRAEKELLFAVDDDDKDIKCLAVIALGNAKSEAAIDRLIDILVWPDARMKGAAMDALVRIGPKAVEKVTQAVAAGKLNPRAADGILALYYQEEVERLLDSLVTDTGGSGFFEGQFRELEKFGKDKAMPVLLRIVSEAGYAFRFADKREKVDRYDLRIRELAVMALGEFGDPRAADALREALKSALPPGAETATGEILVALFRLGEKKPLDEYVQKAQADAGAALAGEAKDEGCNQLFTLGLLFNRVGRRDEAQAIYLKLAAAIEEHHLKSSAENLLGPSLYNLACLASLRGEKARAIEWLGKAVRAGYKDRQWIRMDRDLEPLRNEEGYRALLADDKLFEPKKDE